jgi:leucyl aminopeptidase
MTRLHAVTDPDTALADSGRHDALIVVAHDLPAVAHPLISRAFATASAMDARAAQVVSLAPCADAPGGRVVLSPTGPVLRDHDDVRRYAEAAQAGVRRARDAGARRPLVLLAPPPADARHRHAARVAALAAIGGLWEPLEAREALGASVEPVESIGFSVLGGGFGEADATWVEAVDAGMRLARDLAGTDPERMAPPKFAQYCVDAFRDTAVRVSVNSDLDALRRDYPLLTAVARASLDVERHRPCVVRLEYVPHGAVERTLLFAGKGLTYDTGGADLKTGGHMAGMSRDKGGAAAVAGFMLSVARLGLPGVKVIAELGVVRNSIGPDSFVADEIIASHAGVRVRIGNTDAEGRLVLADLLSHLREDARQATAPRLFSVATLTGHASRAVGPYNIALDNGPARVAGIAEALSKQGDQWGDPFEVSRLRREDYDFVAPRSRADDLLSCNNLPSSATPRGHQFPMAFLAIASGLDRHGSDAAQPLAFTHIDIGGSGVEGSDWQHGRPSARPLVAMLAALT